MSASAILVFDFFRLQHHLVRVDRVRTACEQTLPKLTKPHFFGLVRQLDQAEKACTAGSSSVLTRYCCDITSKPRAHVRFMPGESNKCLHRGVFCHVA
jgi:hypothetical protein